MYFNFDWQNKKGGMPDASGRFFQEATTPPCVCKLVNHDTGQLKHRRIQLDYGCVVRLFSNASRTSVVIQDRPMK